METHAETFKPPTESHERDFVVVVVVEMANRDRKTFINCDSCSELLPRKIIVLCIDWSLCIYLHVF